MPDTAIWFAVDLIYDKNKYSVFSFFVFVFFLIYENVVGILVCFLTVFEISFWSIPDCKLKTIHKIQQCENEKEFRSKKKKNKVPQFI